MALEAKGASAAEVRKATNNLEEAIARGAEAAGANALWVELVRLAWQEEDPMMLPGSSAREFFRQMRQPPAIM